MSPLQRDQIHQRQTVEVYFTQRTSLIQVPNSLNSIISSVENSFSQKRNIVNLRLYTEWYRRNEFHSILVSPHELCCALPPFTVWGVWMKGILVDSREQIIHNQCEVCPNDRPSLLSISFLESTQIPYWWTSFVI